MSFRTRSAYLHHFLETAGIRRKLLTECADFIANCINSSNPIVSIISQVSSYSTSTVADYVRQCLYELKLEMQKPSMYGGKLSKTPIIKTTHVSIYSYRRKDIRELCVLRDGLYMAILGREDVRGLLEYISTS